MVTHFSTRNGKFNGIFTYINQHFYSSFPDYIQCDSLFYIHSWHQTYQQIFPPTEENHVVQEGENASFTFTFNKFSINVTSYSLKMSSYAHRFLSHWTLEASNSGSEWKKIHEIPRCDDCYLYPESN